MRERILIDRGVLGYETWEKVKMHYSGYEIVSSGDHDYKLPDALWLVPPSQMSKLNKILKPNPKDIPGLKYLKPQVNPVDILVYAHRRASYFELTLNSLLWNLSNQPEVRVSILLSNPTDPVKNLAMKFARKRPNTYLWSTDNVAYGAINLLLQLTSAIKFMILEEDFILPHHTEELLPMWAYRFSDILDQGYDLTGFSTSIENLPNHFIRHYDSTVREFPNPNIHKWLVDWPYPQITGNGLCLCSSFYLNATPRNPPFYATGDGDLVKQARRTAFSSIRGYHIGFNQEMDGNPNLNSMTRFPNPSDAHKVVNLIDNSVTVLNISGKRVI